MADTTTAAPAAKDTTTAAAPAQPAPTAKPEKAKIPMGAGGSFSLDEFNTSIGKEDVVDEADEPENDMDGGELAAKQEAGDEQEEGDEEVADEDLEEAEDENEGEEDSDEDEGADEDDAELEELGKGVKKGGVKAFTKNGKAVVLPPDLEIEQVIDGETHKINLREHLNVVAGELTVQSRLGKIASFREEVETRRKEIEGAHTKFHTSLKTVVDLVEEGKPDLAICFLAEMQGKSPVEIKRNFMKALVAEAAKFEGKSDVEIENYYLNLEKKWRDHKSKKEADKTDAQKKANEWVAFVTGELKKENISPQEFTAANNDLRKNGELEGLSQDAALDKVIEHALLTKHSTMAKDAIRLVDPKLTENKKLFDLLLEFTHPNKFTVEEMASVVREYLGKATTRVSTSLSKKVGHKPTKVPSKSEKQNGAGKDKRTYRSQGDLGRAFGF